MHREASEESNKCDYRDESSACEVPLEGNILHKHDEPDSRKFCDETSTSGSCLTKPTQVHAEVRIFICMLCCQSFGEKKSLESHMLTYHSSKRSLCCTICNKSFLSRKYLNRHTRRHSKRPHFCQVCCRNFKSRESIEAHMLTHGDGESLSCTICNKNFSSKSHLARHTIIHSGEKPYSCQVCGDSFGRNDNLERHMIITHTEEKPFSCGICHKRFSLKKYLMIHTRTHTQIHSCEKLFPCGVCGENFTRQSSLTNHMRTHNAANTIFSCDMCGKNFTRKRSAREHMMMHISKPTEEPTHSLTECPKRFRLKVDLKEHMETHAGEKSFVSDHCESGSNSNFEWTRPIATHINHDMSHYSLSDVSGNGSSTNHRSEEHMKTNTTSGTSVSCHVCGKRISSMSNLNVHMRIHSGERPFSCEICKTSYRQRIHMIRHMARNHLGNHTNECSATGQIFNEESGQGDNVNSPLEIIEIDTENSSGHDGSQNSCGKYNMMPSIEMRMRATNPLGEMGEDVCEGEFIENAIRVSSSRPVQLADPTNSHWTIRKRTAKGDEIQSRESQHISQGIKNVSIIFSAAQSLQSAITSELPGEEYL